ncbi:DUF1254 domain-containing protein [Nocardia cyriacigeorgica]|uniref:DUF1254 domain-containing protein n=1 Tax=Nocardia cyriacigeorgica TaxID=135487 RepID=UPI002454470F|nr:DUF1254 domain-containing protein [Nocardia cyriacigeorgica]
MTERVSVSSLSRRGLFGTAAGVAATVALAACGSSSESGSSSTTTSGGSDPASIATDAYVFGYPLVLMDATRATAAPTNTLLRYNKTPSPDDKTVVTPNVDTLYSQAWLDLRTEPMVLQIPAMTDRYWLAQILDAWSNTAHNPSSVRPQISSGDPSGPFTYAVTGPGWSGTLPDGLTRLDMPTATAWAIIRFALNDPDDHGAVTALQNQIKLMPLSTWTSAPDTPTPTGIPADRTASPTKQVAAMDGATFFAKLCTLMAADAPAPADADTLTRFATLGITPGGSLTGIDTGTLAAAVQSAQQQIKDYKNPDAKIVNGWTYATNLGTYGTDYSLRANTALTTLGANLPDDTLYPIMNNIPADSGGPTHSYRIHFPAGQLPPADAFWSLTAYTADHFLVPNPDNIYSLGHHPTVTPNPDGSVDLTLAPANPGPDVPVGNWLPIPTSGTFNLALRLYAPHTSAADGHWQPPALTAA